MEVSQTARELLEVIGDPREFRVEAADNEINQQLEELLAEIKKTCTKLLKCSLSIPQGRIGNGYIGNFNRLKRTLADLKDWKPDPQARIADINRDVQKTLNILHAQWNNLLEGLQIFAPFCLLSKEVYELLNKASRETEEHLGQLKVPFEKLDFPLPLS